MIKKKDYRDVFAGAKLPPQVRDLEEAVIGASLFDKKAFNLVARILNSDDFYVEAHSMIFKAMKILYDKKHPIDILTVANQLKIAKELESVGGAYALTMLTSAIASSANIEYHARIILEKSLLRKQIEIHTQMISNCYEEDADAFDLILTGKTMLSNIDRFDNEDYSAKTRMKVTGEAIFKAMNNEGMAGTPTGILKLDKYLGGITGGEYYVFSARSGSFKTALMIYIQHQVSIMEVPTLMFQQEMTPVQLGLREIALKSGMSTQDLRRGRISDMENFNKAVSQVERSKVLVDTSVGQTIAKIRAKTQKAIEEHGIRFIVIDYLNLCDLEIKKHGTEEQAISYHTKEMKSLAKDFNIAVLELAQFNKEASKEPLKPPTMGMLKGSGAIEYSADVVCLFWNPSKYDESFIYEDMPTKDKIAIIVAKNKNGETGLFWHGVRAYNNQFFELEDNFYNSTTPYNANAFTEMNREQEF